MRQLINLIKRNSRLDRLSEKKAEELVKESEEIPRSI